MSSRLTTPRIAVNTGADKSSNQLTPDQAIASSPLMKENGNSPLLYLNEKARASQASSFRLSKDISTANLRWDGSELKEDELREEDEDAMFDRSQDDLHSEADFDEDEREGEGADAQSYSTISKRADFILAHAKKKLNLLEGNLGKARHSLNAPQSISDLRSASSLSSHTSPSVADALDGVETSVKLSPRINFGTPRHLRNIQTRQQAPGHSRMYSDTSVPSPAGNTTKGSRALDGMQNKNVHKTTLSEQSSNSALNTVAEDDETDKSSRIRSLREMYGAASPPPKSTQELRDQAEELRNRINFLQKHTSTDPHRGHQRPNSPPQAGQEERFILQVDALQRSLEDQESVIRQLEERERAASRQDPREEWQQVLESREEGSQFSDDEYDDEYDELPEELLPNVLGAEDVDETKSMAISHEDRADAFDYEHFILHSAMGRGIYRSSSPTQSEESAPSLDGSERSIETERGAVAGTEEHDADDPDGRDHFRNSWDDMQQPNESMASLATTQSFETANEDIGSDAGSDMSGQPPEDNLLETGVGTPWPMPPQPNNAGGQRTMFRDSEIPTPTAAAFPPSVSQMEDRGVQHSSAAARASLNIFDVLMVPEDASGASRALEKHDGELVRACVSSLRRVCQEAMHPGTSTRELRAIRERLEVARRVLSGEL